MNAAIEGEIIINIFVIYSPMDIPDPVTTILTRRQWEILEMRSRGLSTAEIAHDIGTGKQNVIILENRARKKISRARLTLEILESLGRESISVIPAGSHILDAVKQIVTEADRNNIRISGNLVDILASIRRRCINWISNGILVRDVSVSIFSNGNYDLTPVASKEKD